MRILPTSIDKLQIEINTKAVKANDAIDRLVLKLDRLTTSLGRMNTTNLNGLANGVQRLGNAMQIMNGVRTADFTRLATNLQRLGAINVSSLNSAASSMSHLTRAINNLGTVSNNAQQVGAMVGNLARLGGANVQKAATTIPQLATAINNLMTTLSRAPQVSQNVIQLTNSLANLASQGSRVGAATDSINRNLNSTNRTVRSSRSSWGGFASVIGRFYASCFLAIRGINALGESIQDTADYFEAYNYFNVALGKIGSEWEDDFSKYGYDSAEAYADSFATRLQDKLSTLSGLQISSDGMLETTGMKNLGLNIQEITQFSAQLASVTNSVGQVGEVSLATSSAFTKLAGDMSSLFNMDYSQVATNLSSALIGQSRSVYKYGIDITNATLQTYAYSLGVEKAVSEMTQAEKMQLRLIAILDQSRVSWGDQSNTINSLANQMRILKNNMSEISLVLGQLFVPLMEKVLPVVNGLTIAIKNLLVNIAGILGIEIDPNKFGQGFTEIEDELDGITEGTEDATDALEEYKNQLLGFDEAKKLQDVDAKATLDTEQTGGIDLTDEILQATEEYEKFWQQAYDEMDNLSDEWAKYFEQFTKPIEKIFEDIKLGDFFSLGEDVQGLVIELTDFVDSAIKEVKWDDLGENFGKFATGFISKAFQGLPNLANLIMDAGIGITKFISNAIFNVDTNTLQDSMVNGVGEALADIILKLPALVVMSTGITLGLNIDYEWDSEGIKSLLSDDVIAFRDEINEFISSIEEMEIDFEINMNNADAEYAYLDTLKDKYFGLATQTNLTEEQERELQAYRETLISEYPDFEKILEDTTLSYDEQKKAIEDVINSLKKKAKTEAAEQYLVEIEKKRIELQKKINEYDQGSITNAKAKREEADKVYEQYDELQEKIQELGKERDEAFNIPDHHRMEEIDEEIESLTSQSKELMNKYVGLIDSANLLDSSYQDMLTTMDELNSDYEYYVDYAAGVVTADSTIKEANNQTSESFNNLSTNASNAGTTAGKDFATNTSKELSKGQSTISNSLNALKSLFNVFKSDVKNTFLSKDFEQSGKNIPKGMSAGINNETQQNNVIAGAKTLKTKIQNVFSVTNFESLGKNVIKGLQKGITNPWEQQGVIDDVTVFAGKTALAAKRALDIHSPSGVFEDIGIFTIEGFNVGLKEMFADSYRLISNWGTNLERNATTSLDGLTMATSSANFNTFATQEYSSSINVNNHDEIALLKQQNSLLQQLLQKETAVISPDADGLFKVVQNKANNYTQQTGQPAFII